MTIDQNSDTFGEWIKKAGFLVVPSMDNRHPSFLFESLTLSSDEEIPFKLRILGYDHTQRLTSFSYEKNQQEKVWARCCLYGVLSGWRFEEYDSKVKLISVQCRSRLDVVVLRELIFCDWIDNHMEWWSMEIDYPDSQLKSETVAESWIGYLVFEKPVELTTVSRIPLCLKRGGVEGDVALLDSLKKQVPDIGTLTVSEVVENVTDASLPTGAEVTNLNRLASSGQEESNIKHTLVARLQGMSKWQMLLYILSFALVCAVGFLVVTGAGSRWLGSKLGNKDTIFGKLVDKWCTRSTLFHKNSKFHRSPKFNQFYADVCTGVEFYSALSALQLYDYDNRDHIILDLERYGKVSVVDVELKQSNWHVKLRTASSCLIGSAQEFVEVVASRGEPQWMYLLT